MIDQVRPADLNAWLEAARATREPLVLDVREPHELAIANIQTNAEASGFELLTIPMGALVARLAELDPERPIACLCHHGGRSMQVANYLASRGFEKVANIAGGIDAWSAQVDPSIARY